MRMGTAIGFNQGQFGDVCMGTVAARSFKQKFPDAKLCLGINEKYKSIKPLFENNELIDSLHVWDGYDNWPTEKDMSHLRLANYDKVFNPMPAHTEPLWYLKRHQTEELCLMHWLTPPKNLQVSLSDYFSSGIKDYITVCFSGVTRGEVKSLTLERAKELCCAIRNKFNLKVYQLGLDQDPLYSDDRFNGSFLDATKFMLESKLLVTVDTSWAWIASGYSKSVVGLYSYSYYPGSTTAKNWQPVNSNAAYLEASNVNDINIDEILESIKNHL